MTGPPILEVGDARSLPLADATVDLIATSPVYALGIEYIGGDVRPDDWPAFMRAWLAEWLRVTKPSGRLALNVPLDTTKGGRRLGRSILSRPTYHEVLGAALAVGWLHKATIVWDEGNTTKGNRALGSRTSAARPHPVDSSEMIVFLTNGEWGPSSDNPDDITPAEWQEYGRAPWRFPGAPRRKGGHPAPFPDELAYRCIRYLSRVGDTVLDPMMGSGTTCRVAHRLGRRAIGFDIVLEYVELARRALVAGKEQAA